MAVILKKNKGGEREVQPQLLSGNSLLTQLHFAAVVRSLKQLQAGTKLNVAVGSAALQHKCCKGTQQKELIG